MCTCRSSQTHHELELLLNILLRLRCIYLIGPESVKPENAFPVEDHPKRTITRGAQSNGHKHTEQEDSEDGVLVPTSPVSDTAIGIVEIADVEVDVIDDAGNPSTSLAQTNLSAVSSPSSSSSQLSIGPYQLSVLKRLGARMNVLPIISHADTLTDSQLAEIKAAVRLGLETDKSESGFGVFDDGPNIPEADDDDEEDDGADSADEEGRLTRLVVKIRSTRRPRDRGASFNRSERSRSRTRAALTNEDEDNELTEDDKSPANISFTPSALRQLLPFAVMSPDPVPSSISSRPSSPSAPPPSSYRGSSAHTNATPDHLVGLKGKYVRKYRWGAVDVLNKDHCDFLALRQAIFGTHMRVGGRSSFPMISH